MTAFEIARAIHALPDQPSHADIRSLIAAVECLIEGMTVADYSEVQAHLQDAYIAMDDVYADVPSDADLFEDARDMRRARFNERAA